MCRFALLGQLPRTAEELPIWAMTVPLRMWKTVARADGRTFEDLHAVGIGETARKLLPLRSFYLLFLLLWPLSALGRALRRGPGFGLYWKMAMSRPELAVQHPQSTYTEREVLWGRPDYTLGMFYAYWFNKERASFFALDDKREFARVMAAEGFPLPPALTVEEALSSEGPVVVKDATSDLGYGVSIMAAAELRQLVEPLDQLVLQKRLCNHRTLLKFLPADAPLSSFRVMTMLEPVTKKPVVVRTAMRMGRAGSDVDNTQQGGIWARVAMDNGQIQGGVTRHSFGLYKHGKPVRETHHPDSGKSFVGVRVPWFEEGKRLAVRAHEQVAPEATTLGWDIALCEGAPVFLEVNVWTVLYDYEPDNDIFTPACALMLEKLRELG